MKPLRILLTAAEMAPLVKVGGLGDVIGALPRALAARGHDVRVLIPAYDSGLVQQARPLIRLSSGRGCLLECRAPGLPCPVWLLQTAGLLRRHGQPYVNKKGQPWADNAVQFGLLSRVAANIAGGQWLPEWQPDIVHCNDWHTGLVPVWMYLEKSPAAAVFTIHNLEFTGCFPPAVLHRLQLPDWLNHPEALEFYGSIAFIKGGLRYAHHLTTVSPHYAQEILTPEFGAGLDGLLRVRAEHLNGILNGIDPDVWNPASDPLLTCHFDAVNLAGKRRARHALLTKMKLEDNSADDGQDSPVLIWVGRLTRQKGADLLFEAMPELLRRRLRVLVLGQGERTIEKALMTAARRWSDRLVVHIGFEEALAHQMYAAADLLLMPSRFEPCGLAQLCAMRYGCIPLVVPVGGLADTVWDAGVDHTNGTGFHIAEPKIESVLKTMDRVLSCYADGDRWRQLVRNAMQQRFDWDRSAAAYEQVYRSALSVQRASNPPSTASA